MGIRLVASDLDGTLFNAEHLPAPRTVEAVNALVDAGVIVAAVTGRSWFAGVERATGTGARLDWFVGANGGHRINLQTGTLEERLTFDGTEIEPVVERIETEFPGIGLTFEHAKGQWHNRAMFELLPTSLDGKPRRNTAEHATDDIGKILMVHPELEPGKAMKAVAPCIPDTMNLTSSGVLFTEITPNGADKGSALARLCAQLGIERSEVIAFGDNYNDLTMLEWAGRGVAMGNAEPEVKEIADEITLTNDEFGVAVVLEDLLA